MPESEFVFIRKDFRLASDTARHVASMAIRETAFWVQKKAQESITDQDIIDTGALRRSIYTQTKEMDNRPAALSMAISAGGSPGAHSGRTHDVHEAEEGDQVNDDLEAKIGCCVDYGLIIELGSETVIPRPFLSPVGPLIPAKLEELAKKIGESA